MLKHFIYLISVFSLIVLALPAFAQVTTATVRGSVVDQKGESLVAVNIVATHVPSGAIYGATTRADGRFTLPNLRVGGPYKIQATYIGYQEQTFDNLFLTLDQKRTINFVLTEGTTDLETIEVTAKTPESQVGQTGTDIAINSQLLQKLPTISRQASDYYRLVPAASGNSFLGRNDQFNNFSLDGSIFNNPFGLDAATPGGQTNSQPISLDAIDQIKVSLSPFDVTKSGFTGASIDAVTKSGTNDFAGTVYAFYRNQDMTGGTVRGQELIVPDLQQLQTGFSIGGPIIKDKLFFFANAEIERRTDAGTNFLARRPNLTGENVARVDAQDLELVSNLLLENFGYETGAFENFEHKTESNKGIIKLDWQVNSQNSVTATYNFLDAFQQKPAHPSALGRRGPDFTTLQFFNSGYRINNIIHSGLVEWRSTFGNKYSNKLQAGFTAFRDSRDPFSSPFPVINILQDGIPYIVAGHEPFSINNVLDQNVYQITNNFKIYAGSHTITVGSSLEAFTFDNSFNLDFYGGTFGAFQSVEAFRDTVLNGDFQDEVDNARRAVSSSDFALAETNIGQWGIYAQDEWIINDRLEITYGIRIDVPLYFNTSDKIQESIDRAPAFIPGLEYIDEDGNPIVFEHTQLPDQDPFISPRLGFKWDVQGNNRYTVRGGTGLFTGRFPFVWIGNQVANPNFFFYNVTRPDFRFPQTWRTNLGGDYRFGRGWTAAVDIIYSKDINAMMVRNYGLRPPTGTLGGVDNREIYTPSDRANSFANDAFVFTNTDLGDEFNFSVQISRQWPEGINMTFGYNFTDANSASSIEAEISSDAFARNPALGNVNQAVLSPSLYGNRHRFVGSAYKQWEYGNMATSVAAFFEYVQGGRFSYTYFGDLNGDGSPLNDLIYIPTEADLQEMTFSGDDAASQTSQRNALNEFIAQDEYLSGRRGEYAEAYAILSPWFNRWDFRVLQDFKLKVGERYNTIQFSVDLLNAGNLLNSEWGVQQTARNTQPIGVSGALDEKGAPIYSFDESLNSTFVDILGLQSRWQLQLGLRYIF